MFLSHWKRRSAFPDKKPYNIIVKSNFHNDDKHATSLGTAFSSTIFLGVHRCTRNFGVIARVRQSATAPLFAADGAPQYDKIEATLDKVEKVADGSYMLQVKVSNDDVTLDYKPGHVLALEMEDKSDDWNDDTKRNGGWMRGPYTVSRATEKSLDFLVRVVGKKSKTLVESPLGTPLRFGGKFKVPILDGVNKDLTQKVLLLSTGVGLGPCIGSIEMAMQDESFPPISLLASFREENDVPYRDHLDQLAKDNPHKFEWQPIISSQVGRISSSEENLKQFVGSRIEDMGLSDTHYHVIGNGQMVNEWKKGLKNAGVPEERLTTELYFNSRVDVDEKAIENISSVISSACAVQT